MDLLSIFKRSQPQEGPSAPESAADVVQRARVRARRRLIGAVVLVGIGIVGFPLLFETYPRPLPVDIPIEIANKETAPPLVMPPARAASGAVTGIAGNPGATPAGREAPVEAPAGGGTADSSVAPAGTPPASVAAPSSSVADATPGAPKAAQPAARSPERTAAKSPADKPDRTDKAAGEKPASQAGRATPTGEAARPPTVADTGPAAKADEAAAGGRFALQVGAYSEAGSARLARQKAEKLGLKTYTQVVATPNGERIRVRVGPFASREEADRAAGKLKAAGLPATVLTL